MIILHSITGSQIQMPTGQTCNVKMRGKPGVVRSTPAVLPELECAERTHSSSAHPDAAVQSGAQDSEFLMHSLRSNALESSFPFL